MIAHGAASSCPSDYPTAYGERLAADATTSTYDAQGQQIATTTPAPAGQSGFETTTTTYDAAGNLLTSTDPNGVTTTYTYTPLGKEASIAYSGGSAPSVTYSYDAAGQRIEMTDGTGDTTYSYDPFGELTAEENGAGQTVSYAYDADGDATGITYPLPSTATWATSDSVAYGYDHADELTSVTDFNSNEISITNTADGLPSSESLGSSGDTITTAYDSAHQVSAVDLESTSSTLLGITYADAPSGDILAETDTPSASSSPADYSYDAQSRVTSMTPGTGSTHSYGYDGSGALTTLPNGAAGSYDDAGELTSSTLAGTTTDYAYDADGNQLSATQGTTTVSSASWNGAGELTAYSDAAADMTSASYNGDGLRKRRRRAPSRSGRRRGRSPSLTRGSPVRSAPIGHQTP